MHAKDGMTYAPKADKPKPVVKPGEFVFAAAYYDHGHIFGQTNGLIEAGGVLKYAWDPQPERLKSFCERYKDSGVRPADDFRRILDDPEVHLVTAAAVPCDRGPIGLQVLDAGKDYYTDKSPFTTLEQLEAARAKVKATGRKYMCDYSERLHTEAGWYAGELIEQGAIGRVLQLTVLAPHRLNKPNRPDWFFDKQKYGGIITDIGSHQFEQFLAYTGARDGTVQYARAGNFANPDKPGLEDFGEAIVMTDTGASCYCRVDWFTPDGLRSWGDGRAFILGTQGYMEVRKYIEITQEGPGQRIYLVDGQKEQLIECQGKVGYPFYGKLVLDVLNRTENAMTQEHAFKAAELSMKAQRMADQART